MDLHDPVLSNTFDKKSKMKNLITAIILSAGCLVANPTVASVNKKDSVKALELNTRIFNLSGTSVVYKIELLCEGHVIETTPISSNGNYSFLMQENKKYALRITRNNTIIRQIFLRTGDAEKDQASGKFHFHVDLCNDLNGDTDGFPEGILSVKSKVAVYAPENGISDNTIKN
jgi:hypothetical protein